MRFWPGSSCFVKALICISVCRYAVMHEASTELCLLIHLSICQFELSTYLLLDVSLYLFTHVDMGSSLNQRTSYAK